MPYSRAVNTVTSGQGETVLLFVHGYGCALEDWDAQVKALSDRFRCVAMDLPGHGRSPLPAAATVAELASAVNLVKSQTGGERIILIGHSLGAKVIREAYCESPAHVAGLVLIDGRLVEGDQTAAVKATRESIERMGFSAFTRAAFGPMFPETTPAHLRERIVARACDLDPTFGRDLAIDAILWDEARSRDTLRQIAVPLLVLQSTHSDRDGKRMPMAPDVVTPLMAAVAELVPQARSKAVLNAGHFVMFDEPELVTGEIREFSERA